MDPQINPIVPPQQAPSQNNAIPNPTSAVPKPPTEPVRIVPPAPIQTPPPVEPVKIPPVEPLMTAPSPFINNKTNQKKIGPIIAIFVIVVIVILLALYLFTSNANKQQPIDGSSIAAEEQTTANQQAAPESQPAVTPITNTDDDLQSIQNDLNISTTGMDDQNF